MTSRTRTYDSVKTATPKTPHLVQRSTPAVSLQLVLQKAQMTRGAGLSAEEIGVLHRTIGNRAVGRLVSERTTPNRTGLPDPLKAGIEALSGMDLSGVQVHYNSAKPAQLQALAYTQGADIHVAPGQEQHLPHEAWHVVQQAQGRVTLTMQMKDGVQVNDDKGLEHEAEMMGAKAMQMRRPDHTTTGMSAEADMPVQRKEATGEASQVQGETIGASGEKGRVNLRSIKPTRVEGVGSTIQRLKLKNTNWEKLQRVIGSSSGAGGVLIMDDGTDEKLVVKPEIRAADELIYSKMATGKGVPSYVGISSINQWEVRGLKTRLATTADKNAILGKEATLLWGGDTNRAKALMKKIDDNNTTMIQEAATGSEMKDVVAGSKNIAGGHIKKEEDRESQFASKNKVRDNSPYKLLMDTSFVQTLGILAARDIFIGNFDRLVEKANLENFFVDVDKKKIAGIDNMDVGDYAVGFATTGAATNNELFETWKKNEYVIALKDKKYKDIAAKVMAASGAAGGGHTGTLLELMRTEAAIKIKYVSTEDTWRGSKNEGETDQIKQERLLIEKLLSHEKEMINAFAEGLKVGKEGIKPLKVDESRLQRDPVRTGVEQYRLRYDHMFGKG